MKTWCLAKEAKGAKVRRKVSEEGGLAFGSVNYAGDAVFEMGFVEVDDEAELERDHAKVVISDLFEEIGDLSDGLELNEDEVVDDEIGAKGDFFEKFVVVVDENGLLAFNGESTFDEFTGEGCFVNGFKQTGAELGVHSECRVENGFTDFFLVHGRECLAKEVKVLSKKFIFRTWIGPSLPSYPSRDIFRGSR